MKWLVIGAGGIADRRSIPAIVSKTRKKALGHVDVNFNIPDNAVSSKFEIYGTEGAIILTNTLSQEETGKLEYIHSPQGAYDAQQSRSRDEAQYFEGENGNLYLKQVNAFVDIVKSGKPDYSNAEKAVHIQKLIDKIYNEQ